MIDIEKLKKTRDGDLRHIFPGYTRDTLRRWKREAKEKEAETRDLPKETFLKYLLLGRTRKQLVEKFKDDTDRLLKENYAGYELFTQRNDRNETLHILLPEIEKEITLRPKRWKYHIGKSDRGEAQPYILVQLPNVFIDNKIKIVPLFDAHYGHSAHKKEKLLSYLRWIEETPNVYAIIGGDLMENALDDDRGMSYDQEIQPNTQLNDLKLLFAPVAHKILFAIPGNHEWRTYKRAGIDPLAEFCEKLEIPYFQGPVVMSVMARGYKWLFRVKHGRGSSNTKGGKLNAAGRDRTFTGFIHFYISGHVHDPIVNSETCIVEDAVNCRLIYPTQWVCIAPSFLKWEGSYAYRAEMAPPGRGGLTCELYDNGDYRAVLK